MTDFVIPAKAGIHVPGCIGNCKKENNERVHAEARGARRKDKGNGQGKGNHRGAEARRKDDRGSRGDAGSAEERQRQMATIETQRKG
jgi:hypothetical protein